METPGTFPPSADESPTESMFRMIDVGEKAVTRRRAIAEGRIQMAPATASRIAEKRMPKGDVLALAEVAGIMAAKNTPAILPLCHPLALDSVRVFCEMETDGVRVRCEAICHGKTGVEMEALIGASAALMCVYDLTKGVDPALSIENVHLKSKEGGKSGLWTHPRFPASDLERPSIRKSTRFRNVRAAVLTISDRCFAREAADTSGPLLAEYLKTYGAELVETRILPDDREAIKKAIFLLRENAAVDLILTTGGTGLGPRDVTPEAIREIADKSVAGIGEVLRSSGANFTQNAWLSRSEGYLVGSCLVVLFPGSSKAVAQGLAALGDILPHAIEMVRGGRHESVKHGEVAR